MASSGGVLVTGAAGFIGSHVAGALLARGERVVGLDNFDPFYPAARKRRNLAGVERAAPAGAWAFHEADVCDGKALARIIERERPAGVVHLAARAGVRPSIADPVGYARVNVLGTAVVLEAARAGGCGRVVIASSSSVYGNNPKVPFAETDDVSGPISPYASTKRACELLGHAHHHLTGMPTACLRFFTVFGPRQRPDLAIGRFLRAIGRGEAIEMYGDGSTSRDYTFVADIVGGVLSAYDRIADHGYRIWNLGGSSPVTLAEMIRTAARVVGREAVVDRRPAQPGDVERTFADLTRSRAELGYEPSVGLEEGMRRHWAWMRGEAGEDAA